MNETDFISALRTLPLHSGARNLEDDTAILQIGGETLILTHDMMAERVHFREDADMADIAWKLVAVNLSDLAAKGAEPIGILLGHSLGRDDDRFLDGLRDALEAFNTALLGGDTIKAEGPRSFGITAVGRATHTPVPSRSGARCGDAIYVTGPLGRAMLGFEGHPDHLNALNRPQPLLAEGHKLAPHVTAMMDVSDGLLLDSWRMAKASNVAFHLDSGAIPVAERERFDECVRWGDDYQLLFTASPDTDSPVAATRVGTVTTDDTAPLRIDDTIFASQAGLGYRH